MHYEVNRYSRSGREDTSVVANYLSEPISTARMIMFEPRQIDDIISRPLRYNFNNNFVDTVTTVAERALRNSSAVDSRSFFLQEDMNVAATSIVPDAQGHLVQTSRYSTEYTFMFIVDTRCIDGGLTRTVYNGIAYEVDPSYTGAPNPEALLYFTRMFKVDEVVGRQSNLLGTVDIEVVDPGQNRLISPSSITHDLNPAALADISEHSDGRGIDVYETRVNHGRLVRGPREEEGLRDVWLNGTELSDIPKHIHQIASAISNATNVMELGDNYLPQCEVNASTYTMNQVRTQFINSRRHTDTEVVSPDGDRAKIKLNRLYTLNDLDMMFAGKLEVQMVGYGAYSNVHTALPEAPTARNVYSSLIMDAIQDSLVANGLVSVSFSYNSYSPDDDRLVMIDHRNKGIVKLHNMSSLADVDSETLRRLWTRFYTYLRSYVFAVVFQGSGGRDFQVDVEATVTGTSYIRLNFLDEGTFDPSFIAIESTLGGMNTCNVGTRDLHYANSTQLGVAINDICQNMAPNGYTPDSFSF